MDRLVRNGAQNSWDAILNMVLERISKNVSSCPKMYQVGLKMYPAGYILVKIPDFAPGCLGGPGGHPGGMRAPPECCVHHRLFPYPPRDGPSGSLSRAMLNNIILIALTSQIICVAF